MAELTRQSSFERLQKIVGEESVESVNERKIKAAMDIQEWRKKYRQLRKTKQKLSEILAQSQKIVQILDKVAHSLDFEVSREQLIGIDFRESLDALLTCLPLDPSLKAKNATARNSRTIITAVMVRFFPGVVLVDGTSEKSLTLDTSIESQKCQLSAAILVVNLNKLIRAIKTPFLVHFRRALVGYRFAVRYFMEALDAWKDLDGRRMLQALEAPYMECYSIYLSAEHNEDRQHAEEQCRRFRSAVIELLGPRAQTRLEELNAQVEASINAARDTLNKPTSAPASDSSPGGFEASFAANLKKKKGSPSPTTSPSRKAHINVAATPDSGSTTSSLSPQATVLGTTFPRVFSPAAQSLEQIQPEQPAAMTTRGQLYQQALLHRITTSQTLPSPPAAASFQEISAILHRLKKVLPTTPGTDTGDSSKNTSSSLPAGGGDDGKGHIADNLEALRLMHELTLDPNFRLPPAPSPGIIDLSPYDETTDSSIPGARTQSTDSMIPGSSKAPPVNSIEALAERMRDSMLQLMRDRFVASLTKPTLRSHDEIQVGIRVVVRRPIESAQHKSRNAFYLQTARVIAVNPSKSPSTADADNDADNGGQEPQHPKEIGDTSVVDTGGVPTVDLAYTYNPHEVEKSIPVNRLILSDEPGDPTVFLLALEDVHTQIASLTPNRTDIHTALSSSYDRTLLSQMLSHRALSLNDIRALFQPIVSAIRDLQAPFRTDAMDAWLQRFFNILELKFKLKEGYENALPALPVFFEFCAASVDEIRRDMANFYLQLLSLKARQHGAQYLSHQLSSLAITGAITLDKTASLLHSVIATADALNSLKTDVDEATAVVATTSNAAVLPSATAAAAVTAVYNPSSIGTETAQDPLNFSSRALLAKAFLTLLQLQLRLDTPKALAYVLPETFQWDGKRLARIRDTLDVLSVQCAVAIVTKQLLGKLEIRLLEEEETDFLHRLDVLLRDPEIGISSVSVEAVRLVKHCVARVSEGSPNASSRYLPADWEKSFEQSLRGAITENNPVLQLFTKRLYKVLIRSLLGQPFLGRLPTYSLQAPGLQPNIGLLVGLATRLFKHNLTVNRDIYGLILSSDMFQNALATRSS